MFIFGHVSTRFVVVFLQPYDYNRNWLDNSSGAVQGELTRTESQAADFYLS